MPRFYRSLVKLLRRCPYSPFSTMMDNPQAQLALEFSDGCPDMVRINENQGEQDCYAGEKCKQPHCGGSLAQCGLILKLAKVSHPGVHP